MLQDLLKKELPRVEDKVVLAKECILWNEVKNFTDVYRLIDEYIKFYNEERIHGSLKYISPNQFIRNL